MPMSHWPSYPLACNRQFDAQLLYVVDCKQCNFDGSQTFEMPYHRSTTHRETSTTNLGSKSGTSKLPSRIRYPRGLHTTRQLPTW